MLAESKLVITFVLELRILDDCEALGSNTHSQRTAFLAENSNAFNIYSPALPYAVSHHIQHCNCHDIGSLGV